jgi:hypothetical protein
MGIARAPASGCAHAAFTTSESRFHMSLSGQWLGRYSGSNSGILVIDIDDVGDHYKGTACAWDDDAQLPSSLLRFQTSSKANSHKLDDLTNIPMNPPGVLATKGSSLFPATVNAEIELQEKNLSVKWATPVGTVGGVTAIKTRAGDVSELRPLPFKTWSDFKQYANALPPKRFIFRGQEKAGWRLRTSFHRTGRANLERYLLDDIRDLQKALSPLTRYPLNLNDPLQYGAFLNLAQHHGYPTPLLDWTWSPYVAAFFAFRSIGKSAPTGFSVRIFKLNLAEWNKVPHFDKVFPVPLHVSVLDALAYGNIRATPQQSISTMTNVDDIETHIQTVEHLRATKYLEAIDLRATDRQEVMRELALMGVTAGSLFPGLDGTCESLKERNF